MNSAKEWANYIFWRAGSPEDLEPWIRQIQKATVQQCMRKLLDAVQMDTLKVKETITNIVEESECVA